MTSQRPAAEVKAIIMSALANNGPCMVCEKKGKCRWIGGWLLCEGCAAASPSITSLTQAGALFNSAIHDQVLGQMWWRHQLSQKGEGRPSSAHVRTTGVRSTAHPVDSN